MFFCKQIKYWHGANLYFIYDNSCCFLQGSFAYSSKSSTKICIFKKKHYSYEDNVKIQQQLLLSLFISFFTFYYVIIMWLRFALSGTIFSGLATALMDLTARNKKYDNRQSLVFQYVSIPFFGILVMILYSFSQHTPLFPEISLMTIGMLSITWLIGFGGIWLLFKGFTHLNPAITLVVANLTIFIQYFINIKLFAGNESLSLIKVILAIIFFITVAQFLFMRHRSKTTKIKKTVTSKTLINRIKQIHINKYVLYPIGTAICRTIYIIFNAYFIKNKIFDPAQSIVFTEGSILPFAIVFLLIVKKGWGKNMKQWKLNDMGPYVLIGITQVIALLWYNLAYAHSAINVVNVIRLFQIIFTAIFAWILFKQKLNINEILIMSIAFVVLLVFMVV